MNCHDCFPLLFSFGAVRLDEDGFELFWDAAIGVQVLQFST